MTPVDVIETNVRKIVANLADVNFADWNILVTGGAGFLGSWMCDVLIRQGANVVCMDNLSSGLKKNIAHLLEKSNFSFIQTGISKPVTITDRLNLVIHMASRASPFEFYKYPLEILKANTLGTMSVLEIARKSGARFLYTSTSEVYGEPAVVPTPESYRGNVSPIGPRACYDESKRCGEAIVMAYHNQYALDVRIARIFNTYGPRMREDGIYGRVVPRFLDQGLSGKPLTIFGSGEQTRSFCYVTDQSEGLLKLAHSKNAIGKVVNIGNNNEINILDLAHKIKSLTNSNSDIMFQPLPQDDPTRRCPDISVAILLLDWEPRTGLESGLINFMEWFSSRCSQK